MRITLPLVIAGCLVLGAIGVRTIAADPPEPVSATVETRFRDEVRPFLESYCLRCHGKDTPKGDVDLSALATAESALKALDRWEQVLEQLESDAMPPAKVSRRPSDQARDAVIAWIGSARRLEAARHAGDPGSVPARRLSNAEYDNTIRDLTGVDIRPTKEFPVDPANEAGFDNSAESLTMSPALLKKYLEAARRVAEHVVLTTDGLGFAPHPMLADTDRDKYCVRRVIEFYGRQKTDYAEYFLAAWRFQRRNPPGAPLRPLAAFADDQGLSRGYLATLWKTLESPGAEVGPIAALQAMWRALPPDRDQEEAARDGCKRMRDFVVALRRRLVPEVPNLRARRISEGTQPFVLWKNRRIAENRMRYAGGAEKIQVDGLGLTKSAAKALAVPKSAEEFKRFERTFEPFCRIFPDAFFVSERGRIYLAKEDTHNTGRLLSAGFHSMTGYFRDDGPLSELLLDDDGRRELDRLWREFDMITGAPMRQYSSYLWYERAETGFLRGDGRFDFVRAEDQDASSPAKMGRFAKVYLAKAREVGASDQAISAIEDQFRIIGETIRRVERDRIEAEPRHVEAIQAFAERAYRRPLSPEDRRGVADFYRSLRKDDGLSHEDAVRDAVTGVLMSPRFLYRVDLPGRGGAIRPLSNHDLASRLSYFLWASMPDQELLSHAAAGDLGQPGVLASQARRMLHDDRVRGLAAEFAGNWLDFRRFEEHNGVDRGRFPSFNDALRRSMFEEPIRFFVDLVQNDRPVTEFLDGKHTFVDAPLARHYGMPAPGEGWVRVDDATRFGRGGLLPMAVFLTKNSPGLRTSPVKRGYWVVKRLLGEAIPAPPANVPTLPDDEAKLGDLTLRETLARHRSDKACAGCHARFDGFGLAFEGYGPTGEARTVDLGGRTVDARVPFPDGGEGVGLEGLRSYLHKARLAAFEENLRRKLLAYALGRTLIPSDDLTIEAMTARLSADGGRFSSLVDVIVASPQFRNKRFDSDKVE